MNKIWLDITNTPHVHFLLSIYEALCRKEYFHCTITARDFSETVKLLEQKKTYPFQIIGGHHGKNYLKKVGGLIHRFHQILSFDVDYDISISCGSESAIWNSFLKRKKSIAFGDNDLARQWTYGYLVDYAFFPDAISPRVLHSQGLKARKLFQYSGYKEDLYLADFHPDHEFLNTLPFKEYIIVRPENVMANYIRNSNAKTITPTLLKLLSDKGYNILYLPRYEIDRKYADGLNNIFMPDTAINGLNACYFSNGVLTGAGTFAREAACLGVPSFSFFAGSDLMAVDKKLIQDKKLFFSRDATELVEKLTNSIKHAPDLTRAKNVRDSVIDVLYEVIRQ